MSSRRHLKSRPLPSIPLRLFVVLMALLQFVAPTWHICEMGGHAMSMSRGMSMASHPGNIPLATADDSDAPQRAIICYCPAKPSHEEPSGSHLSETLSPADHATCLALLLQTMPGTIAPPLALERLGEPVVFGWHVARETSHSVAFFGRFRGRAPPQNC